MKIMNTCLGDLWRNLHWRTHYLNTTYIVLGIINSLNIFMPSCVRNLSIRILVSMGILKLIPHRYQGVDGWMYTITSVLDCFETP